MGIPAFGVNPFRKTRVTATRNRLKMTGANTQPCLTPTNTSNWSNSCPPTVTLADNAYSNYAPLERTARRPRSIQTPCFRTYNLPQTLHGDRARRGHQKGVIHFSIQRIVFPTGCTEKFGVIDRRAVSQQYLRDHGLYGSTSCCICHWPKLWGRAIFDPTAP